MKKRFNILISEDDSDFQFLYKVAITEIDPDIEVHMVYSAEQVMHALFKDRSSQLVNRQNLPNLIIANFKEPFFTINDLAEIRSYERFYHIPICLFASDITPQFTEKAKIAGANEVHSKPYTFSDLKSVLQKILQANEPKKLTKGLFCCRCDDYIEYDNDRGNFANQIKLTDGESRFIKAKFKGSLCIPCINQLKTSYRILNGVYESDNKFIFRGEN